MYREIMRIWQKVSYQHNLSPERSTDAPGEVELTEALLAFVCGGSLFPASDGGDVYIDAGAPEYIDKRLTK